MITMYYYHICYNWIPRFPSITLPGGKFYGGWLRSIPLWFPRQTVPHSTFQLPKYTMYTWSHLRGKLLNYGMEYGSIPDAEFRIYKCCIGKHVFFLLIEIPLVNYWTIIKMSQWQIKRSAVLLLPYKVCDKLWHRYVNVDNWIVGGHRSILSNQLLRCHISYVTFW